MLDLKPTDPEFVRVWNRVSKPRTDAETAETAASAGWAEFLEGRLEAEHQRVRDYRALAFPIPLRESRSRHAHWERPDSSRPAQWISLTPEGRGEPLSDESGGHTDALSERTRRRGGLPPGRRDLHRRHAGGVFLRCAQSCQNGRLALWRIIENAQRI